jgi:DNA-binding PadR family transcriptional regulator
VSIPGRDDKTYSGGLSPEYAVLGLLVHGPAHGYDLHQRLMADLGQIWHCSLSQTYNILKRLEGQGYIAGEVQEQPKLPPRRRFHLTDAGRQRFEAWLYGPTPASVRAIRVEFTTRLYFIHSLEPTKAPLLLEAQSAEIQRGLTRLGKTLAEMPPGQTFNRLGLELRLNQLKAILAWLAECRQALQL